MGLRDKLREILTLKDSPHRLSMAFALGVFVGMTPFLGLHTLIVLAIAWPFRLNKLVAVTGVYVTNPWTIVPIYTSSIWVGAKCLGRKETVPEIDWSHITLMDLLYKLKLLLLPLIVGTLLIGFVSAVISYFVMYHAVKKAHSDG